jgi:hypothetical protein
MFLGPKSLLTKQHPLLLEPSGDWQSQLFFKEFSLSRYKQNRSDVFVNLLEAATKTNNEANNQTKSEKIITHLLTNLNVYTMDSFMNFNRFEIPGEFYHDLR